MRNIININANWKFIKQDAGLPAAYPADWEDVNLPHSWNAVDGAIDLVLATVLVTYWNDTTKIHQHYSSRKKIKIC